MPRLSLSQHCVQTAFPVALACWDSQTLGQGPFAVLSQSSHSHRTPVCWEAVSSTPYIAQSL